MNRRSIFALALVPLVARIVPAPVKSAPVIRIEPDPQFDMEKLKAWVMENQEGITRAIIDGMRKQQELILFSSRPNPGGMIAP